MFTMFTIVVGFILFLLTCAGRILGWIIKELWKLQRSEQAAGKGFHWPAGLVLLCIYILYLGGIIFMLELVNVKIAGPTIRTITTNETLIRFLPGLPDMVKKAERGLINFAERNIWIFFVYFWLFGPFSLAGAIWQIFQAKDPWRSKLNKYSHTVPKKINFAEEEDKALKLAKKIAKKDVLITFLGYDYKNNRPAFIFDEERYRHVHIIGGTGAGKTTSLLLPMMYQDIKKGRGVLFIDAKGDIETAMTIRMLAKSAGRLNDFLIFSMSSPEKSNTYNPLALGNSTQLKDKIIGTIRFTEPHYQRECENGLQILFNELSGERKTLKIVSDILKDPPEKYKSFCDFFRNHGKNIAGVQNEINLIVNSEIGALLDGDEINLMEVYKKSKIVYFALNTLTYGATAARMGRLITGDINTLCGLLQNETDRRDFAVYIDEYGVFGTPNFATTLSQGRSARFMITIAHQSLSDLRKISDEHAGQIKSNTAVKIVMKCSSEDAEDFANELGTYKEIQLTRQVAVDGILVGQQLGTEKIVDEYLINPQEIRMLDVGQAAFKTLYMYGLVALPHIKYTRNELEEIPARLPGKSPAEDANKQIKLELPQSPRSIFDV